MALLIPEEEHGADCKVPNGCNRIVPGKIIFLDNAPTAAVFILGTAIVWQEGVLPAILFFIYCLLSIVLFWCRICPWCQHFGYWGCPCGYGRIARRFFKKKSGRDFRTVFRRNIFVVIPCWLVPLVVGLHRTWTDYSRTALLLLLFFCIVGFVLVPLISRFAGCRSCNMKLQCPWISRAHKDPGRL